MHLRVAPVMTAEQKAYFDERYKLWQWNEEMEREYIRFKEMEYVDKVKSKRIVSYEYKIGERGGRIEYYNKLIDRYGDSINLMLSKDGDYVILAEEGLGSGQKLNSGDVYDDRITIVMRKDGKILIQEYYRSNMEPSVKKPGNSELPAGKYENAYTFRRYDDDNPVKNLNPMTGKPWDYSADKYVKVGDTWYPYRKNIPDGTKDGAPYIAIRVRGSYLIHEGGNKDWNYSEGCFTINKEDYLQFMRNFGVETGPNQWNYSLAWGNNTMRGTVYVIR